MNVGDCEQNFSLYDVEGRFCDLKITATVGESYPWETPEFFIVPIFRFPVCSRKSAPIVVDSAAFYGLI